MNLILFITINDDSTFKVFRALVNSEQLFRDAVIKVDYNYTPWPRHNGNLLWQ